MFGFLLRTSSKNLEHSVNDESFFLSIFKLNLSLKDARKIFEKNYLKDQLNRFSGSISKTSTFIGMDRSALHRKLKELDIDIKNFD